MNHCGDLKYLVPRMGIAKVCVCVCVFFPFLLDVKWMYQPGSHRRKVTQDFFIHLPSAVHPFIFLARRIQPFLSLVDREVELYVLTI